MKRGDTDEETEPCSRRARPVAAADPPAGARDAAVQRAGEAADRAGYRGLPEECGPPQPAPRRHHDPAGPVQEAPLAELRAHLLSAPPALRQAFRGAERARRPDRGA